ncbi:MAG: sigma 54-interacting transcriptional regulator [Bryobacteraceae bacterium]|nr:sigma 54-interacting transcriptional regulator [Bryobacteraceae bacterium]
MQPGYGSRAAPASEDDAIRAILEGTAGVTGEGFFASLVRNVAGALGAAGAWVTEFAPQPKRLRALSFWFEDRYIPQYEYGISGTPCEPVIEKACLVHFPENIIELFPRDPDLKGFRAVSYMGAPLCGADGSILGHLAILDTKPMPAAPRYEALFRIFAARAAAELQRLRAEAETQERELKLSRLLDSAMDAIVELDAHLKVTRANRSAAKTFGAGSTEMAGRDFREFLAPESGRKLSRLAAELDSLPSDRQYLWIPGGLTAQRADGGLFPAEASLSRYEAQRTGFFTLILRNVEDQREAEQRIDALTNESNYFKQEIEELHNFREILGDSPPMLALLRQISQAAPTDATVLICGETGTGKELVARALHAAGRRAQKPLIKVNCAAIAPGLIESEFFGHERGAFTGATLRREGRFALADRGTIFLDEIGELPVDLQAKLLRVLQEGEFEPVGGSRTRKVDVRVVAATNRNLLDEIKEGKFREDLYYRLNVFPIKVPPLRERREDIPQLAARFLKQSCQRIGREPMGLPPECLEPLCAYDWPGNVRELQNVIERAAITSRDGRLRFDALPPRPTALMAEPGDQPATPPVYTEREFRELERANIERALEAAGGRISGPDGAARMLGMPPSTLTSRMKALGVRRLH